MRFCVVFFLWLHVIVLMVLAGRADCTTEDIIRGQGLYLATHSLVPRKIGNPTRFKRRDKASEQLSDFHRHQKYAEILTHSVGIPVGDALNSMTVGPRGPMLLQDFMFLDTMAKFDRERIPERVVHAKGAGAFGEFVVTHDITQYTKAKVFSKIGKTTRIAVRFSTVAGESGSSDTVRDPRGFAIKFYTDEGNWDLAGNNTPVFFVRDALLFPSFIHSQKRNPGTHQRDPDSFWDFITLRQETIHQVMILFSDRGIPNGHRHMNGYGSHTFKLVNTIGNAVYCKFIYKSDQGVEGLDWEVAQQLAGTQPDYSLKDLYDAIAEKNYPSWTFYIQVMTFEQAETFRWNPFDVTKVWPQAEFPLKPVGRFTLNQNPTNYFAEVEQLALDPASMPPGIEPSPDKMLQGRLFAYGDAHRYRLGTNFQQIPVNCPYTSVRNYQRDGYMTVTDNQGGAPNYYPNSFGGPEENVAFIESRYQLSADVARYNSTDDDNFSQPTLFWTKVLKEDERNRLAENIARHVINAHESIQQRTVRMFSKVHVDFGRLLSEALTKLTQDH